jgi:hypothetical protein
MSVSEDPGLIDRTTRTLQIIIIALAASSSIFLLIVVSLGLQPHPNPNPQPAPGAAAPAPAPPAVTLPVITVVAVTFTAICLPLSYVVPRLISESSCKRIAAGTWEPGGQPPGTPPPAGDVGKLVAVYQSQKIVGAALNNGVAFLAVVAYMVEGSPIALGLSVALILGVLLRFPTRPAVEQWVDDKLARVQLERQSARFS